jgi:CheY-like chemotaxis protein
MTLRVLLLEDEDAIRSAVARGLQAAGHQVCACASLAEVRARAPGFRPQALVSDLKLPDGTGLDIARELAVPAVFLSGYATFDDAVAALRAGAVEFLTKPASLRDIRSALERIALRDGGGPAVIDASGPVRTWRSGDDAISAAVVECRSAAWDGPLAALGTYADLAQVLPRTVHRRIAAACLQAVPAGRLVVNLAAEGWTALLEPALPEGDAERLVADLARRWRSDGGRTVIAVGDQAVGEGTGRHPAVTPTPPEEWLWPRELPDGDELDLSGVACVGTWIHAWLRARPSVGVRGARPAVRRQVEQAGIPVCWLDAPRVRPGVSAAERAALLG